MSPEYITRAGIDRREPGPVRTAAASRRRISRGISFCLALLSLLVPAGCTPRRDALNTQLPVVEAAVDDRLARDRLGEAEPIARDLESRLPGVDTYALLGRVLWRTGRLLEAEAYHRRSAQDGQPEGLLGMAHAAVARDELPAAERRLERLLEVAEVADRAARLQAAVALRRGDAAGAGRLLQGASELVDNPRVDLDRAEARALETLDAPYGRWLGSPGRLEVASGDRVRATLDGRPVRAQLSLLAGRSSVATRLGTAEEGGVMAATLGLGGMAAAGVFRVEELPADVDLRVGFDLLSRLHWALDLESGSLEIAPTERALPTPLDLPRTHWVAVRTPRNGLAVQLLAMPRLRARVRATALDLGGESRIDERTATGLGFEGEGTIVDVEVRIGGWQGSVRVDVTDLYPLARDGAVAPRAVLGREMLADWRLSWSPGRMQLAMERRAP